MPPLSLHGRPDVPDCEPITRVPGGEHSELLLKESSFIVLLSTLLLLPANLLLVNLTTVISWWGIGKELIANEPGTLLFHNLFFTSKSDCTRCHMILLFSS